MPPCPPLSCPARICPFRVHCASSNACFLTIRLVLLTLKPSDGATGSSADGAAKPGEPYRFANRPQVLRCRKCQRDNALTAGTVMERTRTPLSIWFWAAYLVSSHTPGISAVQFQRQLGLNRYETAFQILHKLRAGMVRPGRDRIGGQPRDHVEIDELWVGGRTRGEGRGVHNQSLVIAAVEVRPRKPENVKGVPRRNGRYAGRIADGSCAGSFGKIAVRLCRGGGRAGSRGGDRRLGRLCDVARSRLSASAGRGAR